MTKHNYRTTFTGPVAGSSARNPAKKKGHTRSKNFSWTDVALALGLERDIMVDFFERAGMVYRENVGKTNMPRITTTESFEQAGYGEMFMARNKNGAHYSQAVITKKGMAFIKKHYLAALKDVSVNKIAVNTAFRKYGLRRWMNM